MKIISQAVSGELDVKLARLTQEECEQMSVESSQPFLVEVYDDQFCHQAESYGNIDDAQRAFAKAIEAYKGYRS